MMYHTTDKTPMRALFYPIGGSKTLFDECIYIILFACLQVNFPLLFLHQKINAPALSFEDVMQSSSQATNGPLVNRSYSLPESSIIFVYIAAKVCCGVFRTKIILRSGVLRLLFQLVAHHQSKCRCGTFIFAPREYNLYLRGAAT